jgi:hypothetical protein
MLVACGACRATFKVELVRDQRTDVLHFNNPTAVAVSALKGLCAKQSRPILDAFIDAGGVPAAVRLLEDSTCPLTVTYAAGFIESLLDLLVHPSARTMGSTGLADVLFRSGEGCGRNKWDPMFENYFT